MANDIPSDFEHYLAIALRMVEQSARLDYAGKLPHLRDRGSARIATRLVERLRMAGWRIEAPPPPPIDRGL